MEIQIERWFAIETANEAGGCTDPDCLCIHCKGERHVAGTCDQEHCPGDHTGSVWDGVANMNPSKPWSDRIPAAIAKAKELLGDDSFRLRHQYGDEGFATLTATEVALAEALWGTWRALMNELDLPGSHPDVEVPPQALRDFTETVEAL